ncbi:SIS domain-containing protein [Pelotomaculum terephthalicicum JT]|uniref:D-sedoheptulose-7-phosphate isomerase n=1 Tax=Pelotomaculum terephthalicicum TaxID=206393 RepID=UPI001F037E40|nr:SIS domain-containing protein [Pelotomaculum terephthalicicum]MCG9966628.1 SIS domain-containing protein [Pelotomaculum terephthalicicum JT]
MNYIISINQYLNELIKIIQSLDTKSLDCFLSILNNARHKGNTIYVFGNGGSGATASHMTGDFNKGVSYGHKIRFKMICLNDNIPTMLAYGNDVNFSDIFVEQLRNFVKKDDVVIGISGSGNSENVIKGIDLANKVGAITVGLCGYSGGLLKDKVTLAIYINVNDMQKVEDLHMIIVHLAMQILSKDKSFSCGGYEFEL